MILPTNKPPHPPPNGAFSSASRFTSTGPAWMRSGVGCFTPLNTSTHSASKREMRWRFSPYLARITAHRRLVLVLVLCGAIVGSLVAMASPPVYVARAVVYVPSDIDEGICIFPPPSFAVRVASRFDAAAVRVGLPNPKLEDAASRWLNGRR